MIYVGAGGVKKVSSIRIGIDGSRHTSYKVYVGVGGTPYMVWPGIPIYDEGKTGLAGSLVLASSYAGRIVFTSSSSYIQCVGTYNGGGSVNSYYYCYFNTRINLSNYNRMSYRVNITSYPGYSDTSNGGDSNAPQFGSFTASSISLNSDGTVSSSEDLERGQANIGTDQSSSMNYYHDLSSISGSRYLGFWGRINYNSSKNSFTVRITVVALSDLTTSD